MSLGLGRQAAKRTVTSLCGWRAVISLCLLAAVPGLAQAPGRATPAPTRATMPALSPGWNFPQRQTLTYAVDWRVFPAGTATVHLETDGPLQRITVTGDSQGAINLLFRVSDRFQSSFTRATGCSVSFSQQLMEGHRQVDSDLHFDYGQGKLFYDMRNRIARTHSAQTAPIPPCVTDMLSGIWFASSQNLDLGSSFRLPVASGNHVSDVTMHAEARETIRTPSTTYHAIRVQATADSPFLRNRGKLWIWYSDDAQHTPVQMRARLFWGTLTFRLTGIDNK